ncbi:hypothetical protein SDC9_208921 [bioreactor metagenome]|uniref:Uncharacterized protein n=1 Tax=bioreactor metagenome TaxID=1076179 RepID=A0A645JCX2_9ZZZZ
MGFRHRQLQHIRRLNVRHIFEHGHQLRQIVKLGEPGLGTVAGSLRRQLNGGDGFTVVRRPAVKMLQALLLQGVHLQVALDGIQFDHRV